jgi:hypothetical protein
MPNSESRYNWNIVESGVQHHNTNPNPTPKCNKVLITDEKEDPQIKPHCSLLKHKSNFGV